MSKLGEIFSRDLKPDAQAFDEIRISTVPRFKQSGLSGDEWRISAKTEFFRNGKVVHETGARNVEYAVRLLDWHLLEARDNGKGFFGGEGDICDQEGCANVATIALEKIANGCGRCGEIKQIQHTRKYRKFCDSHKIRGDSSLDDNDDNYKQIPLESVIL